MDYYGYSEIAFIGLDKTSATPRVDSSITLDELDMYCDPASKVDTYANLATALLFSSNDLMNV